MPDLSSILYNLVGVSDLITANAEKIISTRTGTDGIAIHQENLSSCIQMVMVTLHTDANAPKI